MSRLLQSVLISCGGADARGHAQELLGTNIAANLQLVVQVAKEYTEQLGAGKIIEMLEAHKSYHGLYYYLGSHIAFSEDPEARRPSARPWPRLLTLHCEHAVVQRPCSGGAASAGASMIFNDGQWPAEEAKEMECITCTSGHCLPFRSQPSSIL